MTQRKVLVRGATNQALDELDATDIPTIPASGVSFTPDGSISATDVQAAIQEVRDEAGSGHTALSLDADADALLSLATQTLGLDTQAANKVLAGPATGADDQPTMRLLVAADIPDISATYRAASQLPSFKWTSGTSFPGSPSSGDYCTRTDLNLTFFYNGTRWLSIDLFHEPLSGTIGTSASTYSANISFGRWAPWHTDYDLWIENFYCSTLVQTTNTGSAYWNFALRKYQSDYTANTVLANPNTSTDTVNVGKTRVTAVGALLVPATYVIMQVDASKTGSPGALAQPAFAISYRLVGP